MEKFRNLGSVEYKGQLCADYLDSGMRTHSSLLSLVLHDYVRSYEIACPDIDRFDPSILWLGMCGALPPHNPLTIFKTRTVLFEYSHPRILLTVVPFRQKAPTSSLSGLEEAICGFASRSILRQSPDLKSDRGTTQSL